MSNPANTLMVIHPYNDAGIWVFDDPATGLVKEPFVAGIPEIIEAIVGEARAFTAIFSANAFPGSRYVLTRQRPDGGGFWYRHAASNQEGWLCPALFRYFAEAPTEIHLDVRAR